MMVYLLPSDEFYRIIGIKIRTVLV